MEINTSENVFFQYTKIEFASLQPIHYAYMMTMSLPFFFYSFAWMYPKYFERTMANPLGQHPSNTVATICYVAKALQIVFTLLCADFSSFPLTAIIFFTICAGFGQLLNSRVYALLGHYGIFYGCRFGIEIEWVNAFPYSHISDPQCVDTAIVLHDTFLHFARYWYICSMWPYSKKTGGVPSNLVFLCSQPPFFLYFCVCLHVSENISSTNFM